VLLTRGALLIVCGVAPACTAVLGIDEEYHLREEAAVCQPPLVPAGGECPAACSGGCDEGTCIIECQSDACAALPIACPPGWSCRVRCTAAGACLDAAIHCPEGYSCDVECSGLSGCRNARVSCNGGPCSLSCSDDARVCDAAQLHCNTGACSASCGGASLPETVCGEACSCLGC
jgi:hypothetical protein